MKLKLYKSSRTVDQSHLHIRGVSPRKRPGTPAEANICLAQSRLPEYFPPDSPCRLDLTVSIGCVTTCNRARRTADNVRGYMLLFTEPPEQACYLSCQPVKRSASALQQSYNVTAGGQKQIGSFARLTVARSRHVYRHCVRRRYVTYRASGLAGGQTGGGRFGHSPYERTLPCRGGGGQHLHIRRVN